MVYARMLADKITRHCSTCYLVNTGWCGGPYGVGHRIDLAATRAMITAILTGRLTDAPTTQDPVFGLHIPREVPGVSTELLTPRKTWSDGAAYDANAKELAERFAKNFDRFPDATPDVKSAGPRT
jgi:phosphoenolpyruvate carboxykinase (ATP)